MALYLVKRDPDEVDYDEHDSAVIRASSPEQALALFEGIAVWKTTPTVTRIAEVGDAEIVHKSFIAG